MSKFLVIHLDTDRKKDVAEVEADNGTEALNKVQGYHDTLQTLYAIEFEDAPPQIWGFQYKHNAHLEHPEAERLGATEGDALEADAE